jgi:tetratricopeptide (TPR) repeat protein
MAGEKVNCRKCGQKVKLPAAKKPAVSDSSGVYESAGPLQPKPVQTEALYECAVCGQQYDVNDVYNQQGTVICKGCFAAQQASEAPLEQAPVEEPSEPSICASCGMQLSPDEVEVVGDQTYCSTCAVLAAAQSIGPSVVASRRRPAPVAKSPGYLTWIIGGAVAAAVLLGVAAMIRSAANRKAATESTSSTNAPIAASPSVVAPTPSEPAPTAPVVDAWNTTNLPVLVDLRRQAIDQESAGKLEDASRTYDQMIQLAQGAPHPNEAITSQLKTARDARQAIEDKLAAMKVPTPAPKPAPVVQSTPAPAAPAVAETRASWEAEHRARIQQLLKQADARMAANDPFNAARLYQELFTLVGGHLTDIHDPTLKQQVANAATTRGKLLVQVKSSPESVSLTAGTLLASGLAALNERHWQAGMEALSDVRELFDRNIKMSDRAKDPNYIMALHGLAIGYLNTKQVPKAGELFEETAPLGAYVDRDPTRELVINRAVTDIIQRTKAMRAAKSIKAYMEKHPEAAADEPMVNLLGTSLFVAEQHTTAKAFLQQCAVLYDKQSKQLEEKRPGEKRWGVEWLPASEAERKFAERQKALDNAAELTRQATIAYNDWVRQQQLYQPHGPSGMRETSMANVNAAEGRYNGLTHAAADAKTKIPNLTWLTEMDPVLPPLPKEITVASAAPANAVDSGAPVLTIPTFTLSGTDTNTTPSSPTDTSPEPSHPVHVSVPRHALAFAIDKRRLISSAEVIGSATAVRMEDAQGLILSAHVVARQDQLALLELDAAQMPGGQLRYLNLADSFAGGAIQCAAVPQENVFGPQPTLLTGQATAPVQTAPWAVNLADHPRLAGSPLLNAQGELVGVVIAKREDARTRLPAVSIRDIREFLTAQNALPSGRSSASWDPSSVFEVTVQED